MGEVFALILVQTIRPPLSYPPVGLCAAGRHLHVVAGRIERNGQLSNRFAWVPEAARACSAKMMRSALDDDGYTNETKLSVLADGAEGLPRVVQDGIKRTLITKLDWFHISMRLRHIE